MCDGSSASDVNALETNVNVTCSRIKALRVQTTWDCLCVDANNWTVSGGEYPFCSFGHLLQTSLSTERFDMGARNQKSGFHDTQHVGKVGRVLSMSVTFIADSVEW